MGSQFGRRVYGILKTGGSDMFELNLSEIEALEKETKTKTKTLEDRVLRLEENGRYIIEAINSIDQSLASVASSVALLAGQLKRNGGEA